MNIVALSESTTPRWDRFVEASSDTWLFHLSDWMRVEQPAGFAPSFFLEVDGEVAGIFPLYVGTTRYAGLFNARMLHTGIARSGPAVAVHFGRKQYAAVYRALLDQADAIAAAHKADRLEVRLPGLAPAHLPPLRRPTSPLTRFGGFGALRYGRSLERPIVNDKIVDLSKSEDELWMDLDDDCRKAIRKARRESLTVTVAASTSDLTDYYDLHVANYRLTGAGILPLEHFRRMWDRLQPPGFMHVLFAEQDGRRIAGLIMLTYRDGATYWAGSSLRDTQTVRPNNLLMWQAMLMAKSQGRGWFELGPIVGTGPGSKAQRIGRFKDQFGGDYFSLHEGVRTYRPLKVGGFEWLDALAANVVSARGRR